MGFSFIDSPRYFLTSESVTEGHPDKLCDQISDAVLDSIYERDPEGRVACEAAITNGLVIVMGEVTTDTYVDVPLLVRETLREAGYTNADYGIDYKSCGVAVSPSGAVQRHQRLGKPLSRGKAERDQQQQPRGHGPDWCGRPGHDGGIRLQ